MRHVYSDLFDFYNILLSQNYLKDTVSCQNFDTLYVIKRKMDEMDGTPWESRYSHCTASLEYRTYIAYCHEKHYR